MSAAFTIGIAKSIVGEAHEVPFTGPLSWLYAGEAAAAFIAAVAEARDSAEVFNLNGPCATIEEARVVLDEGAGIVHAIYHGDSCIWHAEFSMGYENE